MVQLELGGGRRSPDRTGATLRRDIKVEEKQYLEGEARKRITISLILMGIFFT